MRILLELRIITSRIERMPKGPQRVRNYVTKTAFLQLYKTGNHKNQFVQSGLYEFASQMSTDNNNDAENSFLHLNISTEGDSK